MKEEKEDNIRNLMKFYYKASSIKLYRDLSFSKSYFLYFITNKLGFDVEICNIYIIKNTVLFSPWKSFLWLLEYEPHEYIKELKCTRKEFIKRATHRSVLDIEILIDIDEPGRFDTIKDKARHIIKQLKKDNTIHTTYFSG